MGDRWHSASGAAGCSGRAQPGTLALETAARATYGQRGAWSAGIYNCRRIGTGPSWSLHAEGRALDWATPAELGDELLELLRASSWELGLQRVIWARTVYDEQTPAGRPYGGDDPHTTHLHIEQAWIGALYLSPAAALSIFVRSGEDVPAVLIMLRSSENPEASTRWLLVGNKRLHLESNANVVELEDAGVPTIALTDRALAYFAVLP